MRDVNNADTVRGEEGARDVENFLLFIWCAYLAWCVIISLVGEPAILCNGGINLGNYPASWRSVNASGMGPILWMAPIVALLPILAIGAVVSPLYCIWWLFIGRPEKIGVFFAEFYSDTAEIVKKHYRRAPQMWTIWLLLFSFCVFNTFGRFHRDVQHYGNGGYVRVFDRLLNVQTSGTFRDCPRDR